MVSINKTQTIHRYICFLNDFSDVAEEFITIRVEQIDLEKVQKLIQTIVLL